MKNTSIQDLGELFFVINFLIMKNIKPKKELDKKSNLEKGLSNQKLEIKQIALSNKGIHDFENKLEGFLGDNDFDN